MLLSESPTEVGAIQDLTNSEENMSQYSAVGHERISCAMLG